MSEGTRVILRTMNGPPGKDGEVTLERLATELEPYAKQSDLLAEATRVDNLVQGQGTLLNLVNSGRLSPGGVATAARAATTRGTLPSGTDLNTLDTLGGADEAGAWLLSGSYTYGNQPPRTPGATAVLEVVVANAYTGIIQRITEASGATWARNKVSTGAGAWTTWRRMDPHVDTTVGTRVFVGDVMIYGDTGRRDVSSLLISPVWDIKALDSVVLAREGHRVDFAARMTVSDEGVGTLRNSTGIIQAPPGFRPDGYSIWGMVTTNTGIAALRTVTSYGAIEIRESGGTWEPGEVVRAIGSWRTPDAWPTNLPGTPA